MSRDMTDDMYRLYEKYGFLKSQITKEQLRFRVETLQVEELNELLAAFDAGNAEELVDALIDTIVIAIGTLVMLGVNVEQAWDAVLAANNAKERGIKSTRPDSGGFDLKKPANWQTPDHGDNHGVLDELFEVD